MFYFTDQQKQKALIWLAFWHILIIALSNFLVQFPFNFFGLDSTWGALSFPFIFLTTDLTVRIFGAPLARKIIFCVMFPALALSYLISIAFYNNLFKNPEALLQVDWFVARIALASFCAYLFGQLLDIKVFDRLRAKARWWIAPTASTILGNALDTLIFFFIAFWQSNDAFMAENWFQIGLLDYGFKLFFSLVLFLPFYGILLKTLIHKLTDLGLKDYPVAH
ncbi:7-cyano-7-deazaguanine/7-aminomethyl-7-deazaguanine transporter [Rappaport israeli]|uniref:7-cyano-7-deazaguanine/7-aminomethyl-7- deazaguanine transporter n=1 Tax=Rappaport israeli TaxID=1839807 RepID=UPI000930063B|nr:7-cyano-7-deazaguanine/7-aminomethyl-7-deazaguanine transporter [Rappaport israeli]